MPGHALALTWVQRTASIGLNAQSTTDCLRQATPCGANDLWWFRNINRMSIAYDFRPRLRPD
jgi:hypothetical protein